MGKNARKLNLDLRSFKKSKAILFTGGTDEELFLRTILNKTKKYDLTMNANGGFVMVLE